MTSLANLGHANRQPLLARLAVRLRELDAGLGEALARPAGRDRTHRYHCTVAARVRPSV